MRRFGRDNRPQFALLAAPWFASTSDPIRMASRSSRSGTRDDGPVTSGPGILEIVYLIVLAGALAATVVITVRFWRK